ncbi:MAG: exo-alpha-sialidase [Fibrella sp.]|nr:exo-alpha-sialidase [Armatimonadota bacterium]
MQPSPLFRWAPLALGGAVLTASCLGGQGAANTKSPSQASGNSHTAVENSAPVVRTVVTSTQIAGAGEPQVAVGTGKRVYVAFGAGDTLYASLSTDGGSTYGAPVRVGTAGRLSLGMRRGPRIVATPKGAVITAVYGKKGDGRDGELMSWQSVDGGKTWLGPTVVNDVPGAAREGLHAMAVAPDGTLACAWLDLREAGTQVFAAFSRDGGKTWGKNVRVYRSPAGNVCECCHPSLADGPDNRLHIILRNWLGGARDMYVSSTGDGGKSFSPARKLGSGTWPLNACPMDGGALAAAKGDVATFWRRENTMYLAQTSGANTGETKIGTGQQGWIAATERGTYLAWLRGRSGSPLLILTPNATTPLVIANSAQNPVVVAGPGPDPVVVTVWSDRQGIRSATLAMGD